MTIPSRPSNLHILALAISLALPITQSTLALADDKLKPNSKTVEHAFQAAKGYSSSEMRILTELEKETSFEYLDQPLRDVVDDISFRHDIPILISVTALEEYGIGTDTPLSMSLKGVSLKSALNLMLAEIDLTYILKDDCMQITTTEAGNAHVTVRAYSVGRGSASEQLVEVIQKLSRSDTEVIEYQDHLIVKGNFRSQQQVMRLLKMLLPISTTPTRGDLTKPLPRLTPRN